MTFHLCISFYSKACLNKIRWGKFWLSSKEYPVGILTDKTCAWFQKSVKIQIITATTTKNAREIWEIAFTEECSCCTIVLQSIGQGLPLHI